MKSHKQAYGEPFALMVYHVTDAHGRHRFLTMNSFAIESLGGTDAFEEILATQFQTFELLGTTFVTVSKDLRRCAFLDPPTARRMHMRIDEIRAACPNSSRGIEPWLPDMGEHPLVPINANQAPWNPVSSLRREVGKVSLEEAILVLTDADVRDVVKPEFVSIAIARGGAKVNELKEEVRRNVEPRLIRWMEDAE